MNRPANRAQCGSFGSRSTIRFSPWAVDAYFNPGIRPVVADGVGQLKPLDGATAIALPEPEQEVIVIVHENEGVNLRAEAFGKLRHAPEESAAVVIKAENAFPPGCRG